MTDETAPGAPASPAPAAEAEDTGRRPRWKTVLAWVCLGLALVALLVSSLTVWAKRQALETDKWVQTSTQLLDNDEIRTALGTYIADELFQEADVSAALERRLPSVAKPLAAPLSGTLQTGAENLATDILGRPRFQQLWEEVNRRAHQRLISVLEGKDEGRLTSTGSGDVVLDLIPFVTRLATRLGVAERVPPDAGRLVVLESGQLEEAQTAVNLIRKLSVLLWIAVLALLAAAIWLADGFRRTMVLVAGWGFVGIGLLLLVARRLSGNALVSALAGDTTEEPAASAAWYIGTSLLADLAIGLVVFGLLVVVGAWVSGPSRWATAARRWLAPQFRARTWAVFGVALIVLLLVFLYGPGGDRTLIGTVVFAVLVLLGLWALRRQTLREFPAPADEGAAAPPTTKEAV